MALPRPAALAALAALLALTGCTSDADKPEQPAAGRPPASPTQTVGPTSTPSTPANSPTETPAQPGDAFLPTDLVPGLNATWHWQDGATSLGGKPFGVCAKADLKGIGAVTVRERTYFPPDDSDDSAAQEVAEFADRTSAAQAWSTLDAWRSRCATTIGASHGPKVSRSVSVPVANGLAARWYLVSWMPNGEETGRFEAFGMVKDGTLITVLRMTNSGADYDYPVGKEPMVAMVRRAAARLHAGLGAGTQ